MGDIFSSINKYDLNVELRPHLSLFVSVVFSKIPVINILYRITFLVHSCQNCRNTPPTAISNQPSNYNQLDGSHFGT